MKRTWPAAALVVALLGATACSQADRPVDVVLVTWDTVRADHIGPPPVGASSEGPSAVSATPQWDALARGGVSFTHARTTAPITLPAHASLLTGMFPSRHGARDNGLFALSSGVPTLAEAFQSAGYATAAFVSAAVLAREYGLARGFDHYDDKMTDGTRADVLKISRRRGDATVGAAIDWLNEVPPKRSVFLWIHLYDPHRTWRAPEPWASRFDPYRAEIAFADAQTARLIENLGESGRLQRSILVLTSDHGEGLGEHGEGTHAFFAYDSTMRVPLLLWSAESIVPGVRRGSRVAGPASLIDVAPTLLELANLSAFDSQGRSLLPNLLGEPVPSRLHPLESVAPALHYSTAPIFGLLTKGNEIWFDLPRRERYDMNQDPEQRENLYRESDVSTADELFAAHSWDWPPSGGILELDRSERQRLEALGYATTVDSTFESGEARSIDPKDRIALFNFLNLDAQHYTPEEVLIRADEMRERYGSLLALERFRVDSLAALGRTRDAITLLEAIVAEHPDAADQIEELAWRKRQRSEQLALSAAIRDALARDPMHPSAERDLALTLHQLQELEEAEALYRGMLERHPEDDVLRANLARLLMTRGEHDSALAVLQAGRGRADHAASLDCLAGKVMAHYLEREGEAIEAYRSCAAAGGRLEPIDLDVLDRARL